MWWRLPRMHTAESVAAELVAGLKDGSIVLDESDLDGPDDPVADEVGDAVTAAVAESRRDAKSLAETLAAVTAAAERVLRGAT